MLWDTDSCRGDQNIRKVYYTKTNAAFVVFNISDRKCFKEADCWLSLISPFQKRVCLVGIQIESNTREVTENEVNNFCKLRGVKYYEISLADMASADHAFLDIADQ